MAMVFVTSFQLRGKTKLQEQTYIYQGHQLEGYFRIMTCLFHSSTPKNVHFCPKIWHPALKYGLLQRCKNIFLEEGTVARLLKNIIIPLKLAFIYLVRHLDNEFLNSELIIPMCFAPMSSKDNFHWNYRTQLPLLKFHNISYSQSHRSTLMKQCLLESSLSCHPFVL